MRRPLTILFCTMTICIFNAYSQTIITPERITTKDGLSQGFIHDMHQDQEGFLWFATKNGLNRYDGEHFEVFTHDYNNPYSISDDRVHVIQEHEDFLLIGTLAGGFNLYHKGTRRFYKIPVTDPKLKFWTSLDVSDIIIDQHGHCWVYSYTLGRLVRLSFPENFWQDFPENEGLLQEIQMKSISNVWLLPKKVENELWVFDYDGKLLKINSSTLEREDLKISWPIETPYMLGYGQHSTGEFMTFGTPEIKKIFLLQKDNWLTIPTDFEIKALFYRAEERQLWINSENELLMFENWEPSQKPLAKSTANFVIRTTSTNENFKSLLTDQSGNLWVSTNGYGLLKINPRFLKIQNLFEGNSINGTPFMNTDNEIWIATREGPMLSTKDHPPQVLPNSGTKWLVDKKGKNWAISRDYFNMEIMQFDENSNIFLRDTSITLEDPRWFHAATIQMDKGLIWIATHDRKLIRYEIKTQNKTEYSFKHLFHDVLTCNAIAFTPDEHCWIATPRGLVHAIPNQEGFDFELISSTNGLLNIDVSSLLPDPIEKHILWVATKGGGVHRLDMQTTTFTYLNSKSSLPPHQSKLPNDVIYGILNDEDGNLWMSSNKGIIRYHIESGKLSNFTEADGMQNDEFNTWAYAKAHTGELMFGGIDGLNVFHPNDLKDQTVLPNTLITSIAVNNQSVTVGDSTGVLIRAPEFTEEITLPFSKNSISIEYAALEYSAPFKNRYRYYLEGAEPEWDHEDMENRANYLNLSPGSYTFKVKGSNGDGIWNETPTELKINILPPWYRSTLAYLVYALLAGFLIWRFRQYEKAKLQMRHAADLKDQETVRLKELDAAKSKLYTNITHEFRTPLTVISGIANQLDGNEEKKDLIKRNSHQLLNLVNQMLELRKLESGSLVIKKKQGDIVKFLRYLTESIRSYAQAQGIIIHFISDEESIMMDFDAEKITRIHSNLLSNAVKFSHEGGNVYIQLERKFENRADTKQMLRLTIRDTGVGIPEEKLPYIFERFYQVDDSSTRKGEGTGIGLTLVAELIKAMDGDIEVKSKSGQGTTFNILLPISQEAEMAIQSHWEEERSTPLVEAVISKSSDEEFSEFKVDSKEDKPSVLLVEDNADVIHYLIICLKEFYNIEIAMNGEEGIEKALEEIPDLIVSDVMMPIKDGFELCHTLKNDHRTSHIPIVLLTAKSDIEARLEGLQRGADAYLSKPFHQDELLVILDNQLKLRQRLQARFSMASLTIDASQVNNEAENEAIHQFLLIEDAFLQKIRTLVEKDLSDTEFGMLQLIRGLGMSRSQIYKKVKALTGIAPSQYIRSIRLFHAQNLLKTTELNVSEIAYEVGFSSPSYFSTAYLEEFGSSPNETRK